MSAAEAADSVRVPMLDVNGKRMSAWALNLNIRLVLAEQINRRRVRVVASVGNFETAFLLRRIKRPPTAGS
jgi:hypothetical protein